MIIFTDYITPRLRYAVDFVASQLTDEIWEITNDPILFTSSYKSKINYSSQQYKHVHAINIMPHGFLFEEGLLQQNIKCNKRNFDVVFFQNDDVFGFDIFAAIFYLLSRYEEYLAHQKDNYNRYKHENSLAFQNGFLQIPIVDIWIEKFGKLLRSTFPSFKIKAKKYQFLPTYDIDMAWSFKHKGVLRNGGGLIKDVLKRNPAAVKERIAVLQNKMKDPYDNFKWLDELHQLYRIVPIYFFLLAMRREEKDKNISPKHPAMQNLIRVTAENYNIGIHPSWQSGYKFSALKSEIDTIQQIIGKPVVSSRQHYLRVKLPATYQKLIAAGITEDYSMGYAGYNGFRASTSNPFYWYDLKKEKATPLKIIPFCFMDATSVYYKKEDAQQALNELKNLHESVKKVNGLFCTLFHNDTFRNAEWKKTYETLFQFAEM